MSGNNEFRRFAPRRNIFRDDQCNPDYNQRWMESRDLELIKAKALIDKIAADATEQLVNQVLHGDQEIQMIQVDMDKMLDNNHSLNKELRAYWKKFWKIEVCKAPECQDGKTTRRGSTYTCDDCEWIWFTFEESYQDGIFKTIDVAAEWSKDGNCVATFEKTDTGWILLKEIKIIKPKKNKDAK